MAISKEQLLRMSDDQRKNVSLNGMGDLVIRRLKLKERNELLRGRGEQTDMESGLVLSRLIIARALVEPLLTPEEVDELPAAVVDLLSKEIMDFNGWTKEGQAAVADHFRPAP